MKLLTSWQSTLDLGGDFSSKREQVEAVSIASELAARSDQGSKKKARADAVRANIWMLSKELGDYHLAETEAEACKRLNKLMSQDFFVEHVGSAKQKERRIALASEYQAGSSEETLEAALEAKYEIHSIMETAGLSEQETLALLAIESPEAEKQLSHLNDSTIRKVRERARKKIRACR